MIGGGELKINPTNMEVINKWSIPTNVSKVRIFTRETQYLGKSIASFSTIATSLYTITMSDESF